MSKPVALNKRQGGSYSKDPETGKTTLVEQTKHQEITGFEQTKDVIKIKSTTKKSSAK